MFATTKMSAKGTAANGTSAPTSTSAGANENQEPVRICWHDILFDQQLQAIRDALQDAMPTDSHGPQPALDVARHFSLGVDQNHRSEADHAKNHCTCDKDATSHNHPRRQMSLLNNTPPVTRQRCSVAA